MRTTLVLAITLGASLAGCMSTPDAMVRVRAARDLDCPSDDIVLTKQIGGWYKAAGCGNDTRYRTECSGSTCVVHGESESIIPSRDRPDPGDPMWR